MTKATNKRRIGDEPLRGAPCPHCGVKHRTLTPNECADRSMSETTLNGRVQYRARKYGWKYAHAARVETPQGWRTPMVEGWPDLFLMRKADRRVLVIELKRELEDPEPAQLEWLVLFNLCGIPAIVVKPSDLREGRVNAVLK